MLTKSNRVNNREVSRLFEFGKKLNLGHLTFVFIKENNNNRPKISFLSPKTLFPKAVLRNSARRRGYRVLKNFIRDFPAGLIGVFIFKSKISNTKEIEESIRASLSRI